MNRDQHSVRIPSPCEEIYSYRVTRKNLLISCFKIGDRFDNDTMTLVEVSV